ncbi:MAG: DUF305 domain-containing protein [Bacteroidota bacterium]
MTLAACRVDEPIEPPPAEVADQAAVPVTSEHEFLAVMRMHHLETVDRAQELQEVTEREEMRALADEVISEGQRAITRIETMLEEHYPDAPSDVPYEATTRSLENVPPEEADRVFLEDMIGHEEQAVQTAQYLLASDVEVQQDVESLAETTIETHRQRRNQMVGYLRDWYNTDIGAERGPLN